MLHELLVGVPTHNVIGKGPSLYRQPRALTPVSRRRLFRHDRTDSNDRHDPTTRKDAR